MVIALAADHGGFQLKEALKGWLTTHGYDVQDFGAHQFDEADDYPDFGKPAAQFVAQDPTERRAILLCKSGQGMAMVANKVSGVRAIVVANPAEFTFDESPNVVSFAAATISLDDVQQVLTNWFAFNPNSLADRHARRIAKLE